MHKTTYAQSNQRNNVSKIWLHNADNSKVLGKSEKTLLKVNIQIRGKNNG